MDLAAATDTLYAADPDGFTATRTELVKAARADGDKQLAKEIGQLRKPTRAAWLVNLLARRADGQLAELLELGAALREAQRNLNAAELRTLAGRRTTTLNGLTRRAVELAAADGYQASEAARQEVAQTLQAALADPEQAELVRRGVLSATLRYGGFGPFELTDAPVPAGDGQKPRTESDAEVAAEREAATTAWQQAESDLELARSEADRATESADALADQLEELRTRLAETESAEEKARRAARRARQRVDELAANARAARDRLRQLDPEATR